MAGMAGIEPANAGVKVPCLTAWLHPNAGHGSLSCPENRDRNLHSVTNAGSRTICLGWVMGLEPTTFGTTIRRSNRLSYTHHEGFAGIYWELFGRSSKYADSETGNNGGIRDSMRDGTPEGTRTPGLLLRRQLLYPTELLAHIERGAPKIELERVMGIEPTYPAWKAGVLPLNYTRTLKIDTLRKIAIR